MFSRYLVIVLALGAAVLQASRGAWIETTGLLGLASGLIALRFAPQRPHLKRIALLGFLITAAAIVLVIVRRSH